MRRSPSWWRLPFVVLSLVFLATSGHAQTDSAAGGGAADPERLELARELLTRMKVGESVLFGIEQGLEAQRSSSPDVPEEFWDLFAEQAAASMDTFTDRLAPVYAIRFSAEELRELNAFYGSPVGERLAMESIEISDQVMRTAKLWGLELGMEVAKKLAEQGVDF